MKCLAYISANENFDCKVLVNNFQLLSMSNLKVGSIKAPLELFLGKLTNRRSIFFQFKCRVMVLAAKPKFTQRSQPNIIV